MNGGLFSIMPVAAAVSVKTEKAADTTQGDDKHIAPARQASDVEIVRRADGKDGEEKRHREFQEKIQESLNLKAQLKIEEDPKTGRFVYHLVNRETGEQIRQWPREDMLELARFFHELDGLIVDKTV